ncbi:tRNA (adenosine(37)-N6)-dimethylallyltransferase MiaA [Leptothrix ochracea]|uniref:tRNA (adenosine(37)-N6)-dimethylallyltransferase MiaA n=1 Tax=Leptothrix ochracea TaxID=735331 RepID=UPI0034E1BA6D
MPLASSHTLPCIILTGPTASGKTAAALAIARDFASKDRPVELISVDSALVYRGMDIGTAKPSHAEQAEVPHHLIDIRDPLASYSAADFASDAASLITAIHARGALPVLVGGTMLYLKALLEGIDPLPAADSAVRADLDQRAAILGWPAMHAELARIDPITAARLAPHDAQRIQRALEVWQISGQPLSFFHRRPQEAAPVHDPKVLWLSLEPENRAWLHARVQQRFEVMREAGLIDEVRSLRARGDLHVALPSMRCVGYRQTWALLDGEISTTQWQEQVVASTRQLAKRQLTWLRSTPQRHIIAADGADPVQAVLDQVQVWTERQAC